ncbi:MAG TPA: aldehyde dehydrogenase family protein, partial [Saprospiraceae bacterium]|nr:aldehyde dehydrogenase family protein [Saprospiraceae bacterium]
VPKGNRKEVRNAVEAAHAGTNWGNMTGHARAQVLYFMAENLAVRTAEFAARIVQTTNVDMDEATKEVEKSIERIYYYAARADKYDGNVHNTIQRNVTLAMPEKIGVMAIVCPEEMSLLGFISTVIPALSMGNNIIAVPSEKFPLIALDFYQILETSDVPAGTFNIISGVKDELTDVLAKHDDVDGIWYFGTEIGSKQVELLSTDNLKRTWVNYGKYRDWYDDKLSEGDTFLRHATEIKNIWIPYGV